MRAIVLAFLALINIPSALADWPFVQDHRYCIVDLVDHQGKLIRPFSGLAQGEVLAGDPTGQLFFAACDKARDACAVELAKPATQKKYLYPSCT